MRSFHEIWPHYGFASHKGYATPEHLAALDCHGVCPLHRRSFMPVKEMTMLDASEEAADVAAGHLEVVSLEDAATTIAPVQLPILA
jgi:hypothetical protein